MIAMWPHHAYTTLVYKKNGYCRFLSNCWFNYLLKKQKKKTIWIQVIVMHVAACMRRHKVWRCETPLPLNSQTMEIAPDFPWIHISYYQKGPAIARKNVIVIPTQTYREWGSRYIDPLKWQASAHYQESSVTLHSGTHGGQRVEVDVCNSFNQSS